MHIVVAPDSFKGSLSSRQVASTIEQAILATKHSDTVTVKPMADGGEGTVDALLSSTKGKKVSITCTGPLGDRMNTYYAIMDDNTAVIEVANIAGLVQVPIDKRNPDVTTTYGVGEVILDALDKGCKSMIIGLGGSATNDGGLGLLQALGMKALDQFGKEVNYFGQDLVKIKDVSFTHLDKRLNDVPIQVACDVDNPLCGEKGASTVFGPQKGATSAQVTTYDKALAYYAQVIENKLGRRLQDVAGAGAAGGLGFALLVLNGTLISGAKLIAEASNMKDAMKQADLVITGEGQTDQQTLYGKAPGYIADLAANYNVPTILISGSLAGDLDILRTKFAGCFSIINQPLSLDECINQAEELLFEQTKQIIHLIHSVNRISGMRIR